MKELLTRIETLYDEMKELTLEAGVGKRIYGSVIKADESLTPTELRDRIAFLENVRVKEYATLKYVWSLVSPETWKMYKLLGEHQFPEQIQLYAARSALKSRWKAKYGRSNKDTVVEDSERQ